MLLHLAENVVVCCSESGARTQCLSVSPLCHQRELLCWDLRGCINFTDRLCYDTRRRIVTLSAPPGLHPVAKICIREKNVNP